MAWLFVLIAGFGSVAILDPAAARVGGAPRYFARLPPAQMLLPIACVAALLQIWFF